jgi:hypothetical protein
MIWLKSQRVARTKLRCPLFNEHVKREGPREKTGKAGSVIYIVITPFVVAVRGSVN